MLLAVSPFCDYCNPKCSMMAVWYSSGAKAILSPCAASGTMSRRFGEAHAS